MTDAVVPPYTEAPTVTGPSHDARLPLVHVRRLLASDAEAARQHLRRLDAKTRRLRFGNSVNDAFLDRYAERLIGPDAVVKGLFVDGVLRGLGELRFLNDAHDEAEGAFSIEAAFQGAGHGARMFAMIVATARNRGVRRILLTCLRENQRMQAIARSHGADLSFEAGDVTAEIHRPYADAESLAREWADESQAFAFALIDWRGQRLAAFADAMGRLAGNLLPLVATRP